jgi:PAS domain S-box-containing protein
MANSNQLSTTTVRIELPDEFLSSLRGSNSKHKTDLNIKIGDTENPVYRELLNNFYDAVMITDHYGRVQDFNHRTLDFFKYTSSELPNVNIKDIIHGLSDKTICNLIQNTEKKLLTLMEATCQRINNTTFPAEITVNKITLNKSDFLIFSIRNISRRKEAENDLKSAYQKLNESNKQLQEREKELAHERDLLHTLLSEVPEYISFKDKNLNYHRINNALASLFDLDTPADAIGKNQYDFMPKEIADDLVLEDHKIFETGLPLINHESVFPVNNQEIWLTSSKVPIRDNDGNVEGIITISRDTTEKKKANELLIQAKIKAEEANKLKNDFIANITHELRTPLNPIIGFTTIIKNSYDEYSIDKSLLEEHTNYILEAAVHLQNIIEDLLTIANNEEKTKFKITTFSVDALIAEIVNLHHFQIQKNAINLKILTPTTSSILFHCDRAKLFHIISNFLGNAVKFTPPGGCITIRVETQDDHMVFEVEDNGIGISAKDIAKIFDRFVQAENILTKTYAGTGLGLAIVKELSEVIGCEPFVFSEVDKGSRFGIKIPPTLYEVLT